VVSLLRISRSVSDETLQDAWMPALARSVMLSILMFLVGGLFIGVAFQSYPLYLIAIAAGLAGLASERGKSNAFAKI
jgi:hypothetical protein